MSTKTKAELLKDVEKLQDDVSSLSVKAEAYDKLLSKYNILKTAREEDKTAVENSKMLAGMYQQREKELIKGFSTELLQLKTNVEEQNQTILNLFEMMDNSINQQVFYYTKFKGIFMNMTPPTKEEPPAQ